MLMIIPDHCLDCIYRNGANQDTSTPEKRQSRIRQIQQFVPRPLTVWSHTKTDTEAGAVKVDRRHGREQIRILNPEKEKDSHGLRTRFLEIHARRGYPVEVRVGVGCNEMHLRQ